MAACLTQCTLQLTSNTFCSWKKEEREREFAFAVELAIKFVCKTLKHFDFL